MLRPCPVAVSRCLVPSRHTLLSKSPAGGFRGSEFSLQRNCGSVRFAYVFVYFGCFFALSCGTRTSKATITKSVCPFPVIFRSRTAGVPKSKSDFVPIHFTSLAWRACGRAPCNCTRGADRVLTGWYCRVTCCAGSHCVCHSPVQHRSAQITDMSIFELLVNCASGESVLHPIPSQRATHRRRYNSKCHPQRFARRPPPVWPLQLHATLV